MWISAFNAKYVTKLVYVDELVNGPFFANIVEAPTGATRSQLIETPYWKVARKFVTINSYHSTFDLLNPTNFKYLITVKIVKDSSEVYTFFDEVFEPIGLVVDEDIKVGTLNYQIIALVVTVLRTFNHSIEVKFEDGKALFVDYEYLDDHIRCENYFASAHSTNDCTKCLHHRRSSLATQGNQ